MNLIIPKSIYSRFLLMILLPIVIIQIVTIIIFYERHWENVSNNMENHLISEIKTIINYHINYPDQDQILKDLNQLDMNIVLLSNCDYNFKRSTDHVLRNFQIKLNKSVKYNVDLFYIDNKSKIRSLISLPLGKILQIDFATKRIKNSTTYIFIIWIITTSVLFGLISLVFMKNQVRFIVRLTKVAKEFGQGKVSDFKPSGAQEIRSLGVSFLKMRQNIEKQIKCRTDLLIHIAHDLRTPITRIKLKLALLKKSHAIENINKNINSIENMITNYLNFAKQEGNEESKECDLIHIIKNVINLFNDKRVKFRSNSRSIKMYLKSTAIERALSNIVDNGLRYTSTLLHISLFTNKKSIVINIDDDGIGIAKKDYKRAFEPFSRLESSKDNGYGLGFAIANNIINAHGGKILLAKNKYGGLRVIIKLPI